MLGRSAAMTAVQVREIMKSASLMSCSKVGCLGRFRYDACERVMKDIDPSNSDYRKTKAIVFKKGKEAA